jgi:hypothetical protein
LGGGGAEPRGNTHFDWLLSIVSSKIDWLNSSI